MVSTALQFSRLTKDVQGRCSQGGLVSEGCIVQVLAACGGISPRASWPAECMYTD